ncbi:ABC transporter substrate-binding protein [Halomonas sp. YLGW01]|uniref:ABC transporter substrate-binding protein n=1 Tax=Halomonas sp. YLGW01 TaxID=2773308 RepID=UPI00177DDE12|nr:ABC transporter substrate-binding protein [Halomonas sp. YLGW01]
MIIGTGGPALAETHALKVTFINPGHDQERFWVMVSDTMQAAAEDLSIELDIHYAQRDRARMVALAHQAIEAQEPPDYLILVNEEQQAIPLLAPAESRDVKVLMLLNGPTPDQFDSVGGPNGEYPNWIGVIETNNYDAGARMARRLIEAASSREAPVPALALIGDTLTPASIARNHGMLDVFERSAAVRLDRVLTAHWNAEEAEALTAGYLDWLATRDQGPGIIWAANDPMALGAIQALEAAGIEPGTEVAIAGLNWSPEGVAHVTSGQMVLTDGGHFLAGGFAMVMLRDHADGRLPPRYAWARFPMDALDASRARRFSPYLTSPDWSRVQFADFRRRDGAYDFSPLGVLEQLEAHPP